MDRWPRPSGLPCLDAAAGSGEALQGDASERSGAALQGGRAEGAPPQPARDALPAGHVPDPPGAGLSRAPLRAPGGAAGHQSRRHLARGTDSFSRRTHAEGSLKSDYSPEHNHPRSEWLRPALCRLSAGAARQSGGDAQPGVPQLAVVVQAAGCVGGSEGDGAASPHSARTPAASPAAPAESGHLFAPASPAASTAPAGGSDPQPDRCDPSRPLVCCCDILCIPCSPPVPSTQCVHAC